MNVNSLSGLLLQSIERLAALAPILLGFTLEMKADNSVLENSPKFGYHKLPGDLLIEIALHLEYRQDILNLCLTVRLVLHSFKTIYLISNLHIVTSCSLECVIGPIPGRCVEIECPMRANPWYAHATYRNCKACETSRGQVVHKREYGICYSR